MRNSKEIIKKEINDLLKESHSIFEPEKHLPEENFEYQSWYTKAIKVIKALIPERLDEFNMLYKIDTAAPNNSEFYTIKNYLLSKPLRNHDEKDRFNLMMIKFGQQIAILKSAQTRVDSILTDIKGVLQADLFDNEIDASESLVKAKHYRAAGTLAGVVLESHLKDVCSNHAITTKRNATLADYNDALKNKNVLDVAKWRKIQALGDIRNLCSHKKERDPTREDVEELIAGVKNVIKTVF